MIHPPARSRAARRPALWAAVLLPPLCLGGLLAWAGGVIDPAVISPAHFMQRFHQAGAPDTGFRRAHAKGMCVTGWFDPTPEGRSLSRAGVFKGEHLPVTGRFSLAPPMPYIPDDPHITRSLAVQIRSPAGDDWRMALVNVPLQPMRDMADAFAFFAVSRRNPRTHLPDAAAARAYAAQRPWLATAFAAVKNRSQSSGFANMGYNSLDSFLLKGPDGRQNAVRWSLTPHEAFAPAEGSGADDPDYLFKRLVQELDSHPLRWDVTGTLARPGDAVNDPSQPWDARDRVVTFGTVTFTRAYSEDENPCGPMVFDPTILPDGIAVSGDPLLALRSSVYMRSYATRSGEPKTPSMVTPAMIANPALIPASPPDGTLPGQGATTPPQDGKGH